ncbi:hypothetical protein [Porphyromonas sp. oral taxon 275]|uniref:hypothetical protein n=1 Tax=Porphyromonas sp. oral taxon 275 TaxID=712435 RepID=UPI001BA566AB|nr:hypothetical protein [Porphyromonas sp. oral taxon 275]QUB42566.1 hypothetical protein J4862_06060 [Porphyromonas sp. oral taxon 275]
MSESRCIYKLVFRIPPEGYQTAEFFFHSLAAIYDLFTPYQIGCKVSQLYKVGVRQGIPYEGRKCRVTREPIRRKKSRRKA